MDYDADGDLDILSGSYTGEIYFFEKLANGELKQGVYLKNEAGEALKTGNSVTPEAIDMDNDGDLDLVIGTRSSGVFVFTNSGSRAKPIWPIKGKKLLTKNGKQVKGSNAHHADWNGDGIRDLIVGSERGGADWYQNFGTNTKPVYGEVKSLVKRPSFERRTEEEGPIGPSSRTKVHVTDWNDDGQVDLLIGDVCWLSYTLPPLTPEQEKEKAEITPKYEELKKAYYKIIEKRNSYVGKKGGIPQEVRDRMDAANEALSPYRKKMYSFERERSNTHGYVWLYLGDKAEKQKEEVAQKLSDKFGPTQLSVKTYKLANEDGLLHVEATLSIASGWHVYAKSADPEAYPVIRPSFSCPKGIELASPWTSKSTSLPDPKANGSSWYTESVTFSCVLKTKPAISNCSVEVNFQVCNDQMCYPPKTLIVELPFASRKASTAKL